MKRLLLFLSCFIVMPPVFAAVHVVTTTADSGVGSLRQALIDANADATVPRTINFAIGSGIKTITPLSVLPSLTVTDIIIDGSTQPGWSANDPQIILDGAAAFAFDALIIDGADRCTIQDLVINNGFVNGITMSSGASECAVYGCFIGTDQMGTAASGLAGAAINISAFGADRSSNVIIGAPNRGNVLSGNAAGGFFGGNLTNLHIQGNFVGTDKTGLVEIPNTQVGIAIITMPGSDAVSCINAKIGGLAAGEGNVISGNGPGGFNPVPGIFMGFQPVIGTIIQGNMIGVNRTGTAALPNDFGILTFIDTSSQIATIDGTVIEGNVISGNRADGILLQFPAHNSVVTGNFIGTDITGTMAIANGNNGIGSLSGDDNRIGGALASDKNIISGNVVSGILLQQNTNNAVIQGNYIGTDITGGIALGNGNNGLEVQGSDTDPSNGTVIGGALAGEGNIVSANGISGILFRANVSNSIIKGNFIGTDITGMLDFGNGGSGILIESQFTGSVASTNNSIGGTALADKNTILFNNFGVSIGGGLLSPDILNPILGNSIFANTFNGINLFDGGNNLQEAPVITEALLCPTNAVLTITATAPANPGGSDFRLEFFVNSVDNSPNTEGELFIGAIASVASSGVVTQSFTVPASVAVGQWVSATATNLNNTGGTPGDTSEFSPNVEIQAAVAPLVSLSAVPSIISGGASTTLTATFSGSGPFSALWSDGLFQDPVVSPLVRVVTPASTTNYSVTITDAHGCSTLASDLVTVYQVSDLAEAIITKYC